MYGGFDYYSILGIDHYATRGEVKQAYRRLAKRHHPDLNPNNPTAEEEFQKVHEAYETLYDSSKRKMYDTGFDQTVRAAYASGAYGASNTRNGSAQNFTGSDTKSGASYTHSSYTHSTYTHSGYGYTDFGNADEKIRFEDLSFFEKAELYSKFAFQNLPKLHFIVLGALGILLLIIPFDRSISFSNYTGISMRLTFFVVHAFFSSYWVERSCNNLKSDFIMLPTMLMFTHAAASVISMMLTVMLQALLAMVFHLPKYIMDAWSRV